jgi:hypothetical protein
MRGFEKVPKTPQMHFSPDKNRDETFLISSFKFRVEYWIDEGLVAIKTGMRHLKNLYSIKILKTAKKVEVWDFL